VRPALTHLRLSRPLAVLDVEATGLSPSAARVVEVAALRLDPGDHPRLFRTRLNPGCPIPPAATAVHRITDHDVRHAPPFSAVARPLADLLGGCDLAGFNLAAYDLLLLTHEFARAGVAFPLAGRAVVDVYRLFTRQEPRDLAAAVRFYTGRDHALAHAAAADAWATAEVLDCQVARYPDLPPDPAGLHRLLVEVDVGRRFRRGPGGAVALNFGKYQGVPLAEVAGHDPGYLRWVLTTDLLDDARVFVGRALAGLPPETGATGAGGGT
jgi:DNA polymerase-3 subunit epsilon